MKNLVSKSPQLHFDAQQKCIANGYHTRQCKFYSISVDRKFSWTMMIQINFQLHQTYISLFYVPKIYICINSSKTNKVKKNPHSKKVTFLIKNLQMYKLYVLINLKSTICSSSNSNFLYKLYTEISCCSIIFLCCRK